MSKKGHKRPVEVVRRKVPWSVWLLVLGSGCLVTYSLYAFWRSAPPTPEVLLQQALELEERDPAASEQLLQTAIASAGGWGAYPDAEIVLCCLLAQRGAWSEALAVYATLDKQRCPSERLLAFAQAASQSGPPGAAIDALRLVSRRDGAEKAKALETLLVAYQQQGDKGECIEIARQLIACDPHLPRYHWGLIKLLQETEQHDECRTAVMEALEQCRSKAIQVELRYALVEELVALGDLAAARHELTALEPLDGQSSRYSVVAADLYRLEGRFEAALEASNRALPAASSQPGVYLTRGAVLLDLGRYEEAADDLRRAVALAPFDERAQCKLAEAYRALGDRVAADAHQREGGAIRERRMRLRTLHKKWTSQPGDARLARDIADLHRELGQHPEAKQWEQRADLNSY